MGLSFELSSYFGYPHRAAAFTFSTIFLALLCCALLTPAARFICLAVAFLIIRIFFVREAVVFAKRPLLLFLFAGLLMR